MISLPRVRVKESLCARRFCVAREQAHSQNPLIGSFVTLAPRLTSVVIAHLADVAYKDAHTRPDAFVFSY